MSIIYELIKDSKINRNKKRRWKEKSIIPGEVLERIWNEGIRFQNEPPIDGMKLNRFLDLLWKSVRSPEASNDRKYIDAAIHLYIDTVKNELMPDWRSKIRHKKYLTLKKK